MKKIRTIFLTLIIYLITCSSLLAQDIYSTQFYTAFHRFFFTPEHVGNLFFTIKIDVDSTGKIIKYSLSQNLDSERIFSLSNVFKRMEFDSLIPFLTKNSSNLLPVFVIYYSGKKEFDQKTEYQRMWQFEQLDSLKINILPPIYHQQYSKYRIEN